MTDTLGVSLHDLAGLIGLFCYLGSYGALQLGFLNGQGYAYAALNGTAAAFVLLSLLTAFNLAAAATQVFYLVISITGIVRHYWLTHRARFTHEEKAFLDDVLPSLPRREARRLLDLGLWITGEAGTVLAEEDSRVTHLIYLADGEASVASGGHVIAACEAGSLIGELTALSGGEATASVTLTKQSRYLAIDAERLRALLRRNGSIRAHLEVSFASHVLQKLRVSNAMLARLGRSTV